MGRLAIVEKSAIDEMFEPFFEELPTLAKDKKLQIVFYRSALAMGTRSRYLNEQTIELAKTLQLSDSEQAAQLGEELFEELSSSYLQDLIKD